LEEISLKLWASERSVEEGAGKVRAPYLRFEGAQFTQSVNVLKVKDYCRRNASFSRVSIGVV